MPSHDKSTRSFDSLWNSTRKSSSGGERTDGGGTFFDGSTITEEFTGPVMSSYEASGGTYDGFSAMYDGSTITDPLDGHLSPDVGAKTQFNGADTFYDGSTITEEVTGNTIKGNAQIDFPCHRSSSDLPPVHPDLHPHEMERRKSSSGAGGAKRGSRFPNEPLHIILLATVALALIFGLVVFCVMTALFEVPVRMAAHEGSLLTVGGDILATQQPSSMPSSVPSSLPSISPSSTPSVQPSSVPSSTPSISPSSTPSASPTNTPTSIPSSEPSLKPSSIPSVAPTSTPTTKPSSSPTDVPTSSPSAYPSSQPTGAPTKAPTAAPTSAPTSPPIIFYVMGDVPYSEQEQKNMVRQVREIPDDAEFVVHVGDLHQVVDTNCTRETYQGVRSVLSQSKSPVFIIPGDNDILECPSAFMARFFWTQAFRSFETNWRHSLAVERQSNRYDNFAFVLHNVLFLGIDLVGSSTEDQVQRSSTLETDLQWALENIDRNKKTLEGFVLFGHSRPRSKHRNFFDPLGKRLRSLRIPSLYIHGDGHEWEVEQQFKARNMMRVQVNRGGKEDPVRVRFRADAKNPFEFGRRKL